MKYDIGKLWVEVTIFTFFGCSSDRRSHHNIEPIMKLILSKLNQHILHDY